MTDTSNKFSALEIEKKIIAAIIQSNDLYDTVDSELSFEYFFSQKHQAIWQLITQLSVQSKDFDSSVLIFEAEKRNMLTACGGVEFIRHFEDIPASNKILAHTEILHEKYLYRQINKGIIDVQNQISTPNEGGASEVLDYAQSVFMKIDETQNNANSGFTRLSEHLNDFLEKVEERFNSEGSLTGTSTGLTEVDNIISGLNPSDLIVLAGRPSMGKTTVAMNIVENVSIGTGKRAAVFSLEMPEDQILSRVACSIGKINNESLKTGKLDANDFSKLTKVVSVLESSEIFIDATPGITPAKLRSRARKLHRQAPLDLIVIDYLQLMNGDGKFENRNAEISYISRSLKSLAKELNVPVIALSQLNRSVDSRPIDKRRPVLSDLRESGAIEQDADIIAFIYRDEVYSPGNPQTEGLAELIVAKNRNGPCGTAFLSFEGQYFKFSDFIPRERFSDVDYDTPY